MSNRDRARPGNPKADERGDAPVPTGESAPQSPLAEGMRPALHGAGEVRPPRLAGNRDRARKYGENRAADLADAESRKWINDHACRYVLPWRIEDQAELEAEFDAVQAETWERAIKAASLAVHNRMCETTFGGVETSDVRAAIERLSDPLRETK